MTGFNKSKIHKSASQGPAVHVSEGVWTVKFGNIYFLILQILTYIFIDHKKLTKEHWTFGTYNFALKL